MTPTRERNLTGADRITLKAVMDRMIPPVDDMPGAGALGLAAEVQKMARRAPGLRAALLRTLDALSLDPGARVAGGFLALEEAAQDEAIRTVESALPEPFRVFVEMVYAAYYADERVHERIGWAPHLEGSVADTAEPFDESALDQVRTREPFWRSLDKPSGTPIGGAD